VAFGPVGTGLAAWYCPPSAVLLTPAAFMRGGGGGGDWNWALLRGKVASIARLRALLTLAAGSSSSFQVRSWFRFWRLVLVLVSVPVSVPVPLPASLRFRYRPPFGSVPKKEGHLPNRVRFRFRCGGVPSATRGHCGMRSGVGAEGRGRVARIQVGLGWL